MKEEGFEAGEQILSNEEWNEKSKEIYDLVQKFFGELKRVWGDKFFNEYQDQMKSIEDRILASGISEKEASLYAAWHIIHGGGTSQEYSPNVDFVGELSIQKFLEDKLSTIGQI